MPAACVPARKHLFGWSSILALIATAIAGSTAAGAASAPFGDLQYRSIGPAIAGGRTTVVVGSDRDARLYYAGGADGGVFKSLDGGASWRAVFDRASTASIGTIAISSRNDDDVWVGTGESNPRNDVESGNGVWHSTDGGKTWRHAGLDDAGQISSISIDPRDPRTVVVGVLGPVFRDGQTRGVYLTRDAGAHWTRTLFAGPSSGVSDLARVPDRPATLFAGMYQFRREPWMLTSGGPNGGLYRSDDGGARWRKVEGRGFPGGLTGRIGIAAAKGGRIYAIVQSKLGDVWRSDDGGRSWKAMPHSAYAGERPFYFSRIFVDPANRDRVAVVGLVLSLSRDGGRSFHPIAQNAGWDYHALWWSHDGRRLAVGSDEGAVMSSDGGAHFWQPYDLPFAQPYHVGFGSDLPGYRVCVGLQDDNSWCAPSYAYNGIGVLNRDWLQVGPGDGMWAIVDPSDPDSIWTTSTNSDTGQVYLFDRRTEQAREVSPVARDNAQAPAALPYRFNWDAPIAFTQGAQPRVLVGGNVVFESADRGEHWSVRSPDLTRNDKSHQKASGGPISLDVSGAETSDTILDLETTKLDPAIVWAGTDDGLVQLTRDGGAHWSDVTPHGVAPWGRVATVEPGHFSAGTAFAAIDRHMLGDDRPYVFATADYGATWRSIAGNLPSDSYVRSIREDPHDADLLFAGTQHGVWVSFDRGASWQSLRLNMPATTIYDLEIQPVRDDLLVASHGRGVWILDDLSTLRQLAQARVQPAALFVPRDAYLMWQWAPVNVFNDGTLPDNEFVGVNPGTGALLSFYLQAPARSRPTLEVADASGRTIRHLSGKDVPNVAGINRVVWDLSEDGPEQWSGTFRENRGPLEGPQVVPGRYAVTLHVDGQTYRSSVDVLPDPRSKASLEDYARRHDALEAIYAEIGGANRMLDAIDARLRHADAAQAAALNAFRLQLTYGPRNV
ncbi:MAG TPA: hypothetical protein VJP76_04640 [Candidatus Tumulicola sp.]|nr:hypothetical protein [Candidatus Tumulicola sp.]